MNKTGYIAIAVIGKPVGLGGWSRLYPHGSTLARLDLPVQLMAGFEKPTRTITLTELKEDTKGMSGIFEEFSVREDVDTVKNMTLFIEEEKLPSVDDGNFYHFELEGLSVVTDDGKVLGIVKAVHNYPTVDALEVKKESGSTFVVPMTKDCILAVDSTQKRIVISGSFVEELY